MPIRLRYPSGPLGVVCGAATAVVAVLVLLPMRDALNPATPALILVIPGVLAAVLGGRVAAAVVAGATSVAFGVLFIPPFGHWKILDPEDVTAVVVFLLVALIVGELTARQAVRRSVAETRMAELEALTSRLERAHDEQQRLSRELDKLALMEEVDQQRSALLRSVSHDLRTPLATIRAVSSDLMDDELYDDETRADLLSLVSDEAERLDRLVANLLSLSRIESGSFAPDLQAVVLAELLTATVARLRRVIADHRLELDVPADLPLVHADYTQLDLVVTNLLENAARHSPPRSTIRVGARTSGTMVEAWVENRGDGVIAPDRQRIFEAFHRGHGSRSSGIGLAICKAVVEAHGGTIGVTDAHGGGARFTFTMPILPTPVDQAAVASARRATP
ncbi:sensor histidine kinase [Aquihabitans sp. McL0605]|uniref:sensor histidine kinase n=1 Tax=Aquihabitans sp. McL0605 TaxID=3415671 RepID=UPI003CF00010